MAITAAMVKELRERTGSGMMECKKALVETDGDIEQAVEHMRKKGLAKADKKADRVAAEGKIVAATADGGRRGVLLEVNCETDFVSGGDDFGAFADRAAALILEQQPADVEALLELPADGDKTLNTLRQELVAKIGENIQVRRFNTFQTEGQLHHYLHGTRIGVMVDVQGGDEQLGRDVAMHVAASQPVCVDEGGMPAEVLEKERAILKAQAEESGKPAEIVEKMLDGRMKKFLKETTLLGQPFVKDPDQTVGELLNKAGATVHGFARLEVGEGIEKEEGNFAEEVMAQVRGS
ncbi:translation elongation factor Ts [Methylonatrum kenyense]|uniref:translation elongation factor Ts n=1 Tax=Methylonatrum kenyense TaxID=455253 RepID=UPI0020BD8509|nr:translation elongation factor Ts [Methylonatrum kenyense]MCK8516373.1 translation elongation factor Ts [Methylonatrum kenyense]